MDLGRDLRLVIFDLDGTLIHLDVDWDVVRRAPDTATAQELAGLGGRRLDPAVAAVLAELSGAGYRLAVLSRNSRVVAERALAGVTAPIMIIGREDCPDKPKPDPAGVRAILRAAHAAPENAVLVGDTYHDVEAAHAAGVRAVVVRNDRLAYRPEGADAYVDSLAELVPLLEGDSA